MRKLLLTVMAVLMFSSAQAAGTQAPAQSGAGSAVTVTAGAAAGQTGTAESQTSVDASPASAADAAVSSRDVLGSEVNAALCSSRVRDRTTAIEALQKRGDKLALTVLTALRDNSLYYDRSSCQLYLKSDSGYTELANGATFNGSGLRRSGVSAAQRSAINAFINTAALHSQDAGERLKAVSALVDDPKGKISYAEVTSLLQQEDDSEVYAKLGTLKALLSVNEPNLGVQELVRSVSSLSDAASPEAISALERLQKDQRPEVAEAAKSALSDLEMLKGGSDFAETIFFGLSLGSILVLAALGLAVTFGVMGVINMAHGELIMLGAYTVWILQTLLPEYPGIALLLSIPASFIVSGCFGLLIEKGIIRYLSGRPLETLLATFGVSLILQQLVRTVFSPLNRAVITPEFLQGSVHFGPFLALTYNRLFIIVFCLIVFALTLGVLKHTRLGLEVRAVSQNRAMARALGVRAGRVDAMTFALGSGVAGMAGVALSQITNVGPNLGQNYIVDSFMVVVFGGVGNLYGTLTGGLIMGLANKFLEPFSGAMLSKILILVALIIFIQKRPRGLFPQRGRAVED